MTPRRVEESAAMRAIRHGKITKNVEGMVKRPDGGVSVVLTTAAPIQDGKGRITGAVVAVRDITERKRLEEKLRRAQSSRAWEFWRAESRMISTIC
jgi:PAS domain S-box-containing protein